MSEHPSDDTLESLGAEDTWEQERVTMSDKLAIVFDGPPSHESGRFVEVELNGASVSFGEWQENGDYWELVLPDPYAERAALEARLSKMEEALGQIVEWSKAYPIDVFPEPDFEKVAKVLKDNGMTLDAVSASNMRHVITEVAGMVREALAGESDE